MYVDPRGPRFAAAVTTVVLAAALLLAGSTLGLLLLAGQAVVFAIGAVRGPQASPYGLAFKRFIRPRLSPPVELEDARPPRFAQAVGLGFALTGLLAFVAGATRAGHRRGGAGAGRRLPQCRVRVLPGLRGLPARPSSGSRSRRRLLIPPPRTVPHRKDHPQ